MSYEHYAKFADVWKHLLLCIALDVERPSRYVESNSAFAQYLLSQTPEQLHGIFWFLEHGRSIDVLSQSLYYQLELESNRQPGGPFYLGSPGLAIRVLASHQTSFTFFDLEQAALQSIEEFAFAQTPSIAVDVRRQDSLLGVREVLSEVIADGFLFLDPYDPFTPNGAGDDYFRLFLAAKEIGIKGMLWYGFDSTAQRRQIEERIRSSVEQKRGAPILDVVTNLKSIHNAEKFKNPGVFGCGMACANLSKESERTIEEIVKIFPRVYQTARIYKDQSGELETTSRYY